MNKPFAGVILAGAALLALFGGMSANAAPKPPSPTPTPTATVAPYTLGHQVVTNVQQDANADGVITSVANCPAGKVPTGGGWAEPVGEWTVSDGRILSSVPTATGWEVKIRSGQDSSRQFETKTYVVCVNA